ncbi:MAG: proton-conducting transporter membrane subunit [Pseudomonadota bacterium]
MLLNFLPLMAPAILIAVALFLNAKTERPAASAALFGEGAILATFAVAVASAIVLLVNGASDSMLFGISGIGISARLDIVSVTMLLLVSFIGWIVARYSRTYLEGEPRQTFFFVWLLATLAAVMTLVTSGNLVQFVLAWVATSLCLHKLLLFFPQRVAAQRAARKKFITARVGDIALGAAALALVIGYRTTSISEILELARAGEGGPAVITAVARLAVAALLKSAQFPTHGWLVEVMEAPTPVSALLHAGVVNAGGFVLIRFADVVLLSPLTLAALAMVGGFTALFGGLVMLTQPTVKASLAWSTIAQMGFMILQCGLALFPLALLHIVAHSLYKAHAFLSSGGAVERVAAIRKPGPVAVPNLNKVGLAFLVALVIYGAVFILSGTLLGFGTKSPQAFALGAILIFGVAYLLAQGFADAAPKELTQRTAAYSVAAALSYFVLQRLSEWATLGTLPATPAPGALEWALIALAVFSFGAVALAQATFPLWSHHPAAQGLRVHLANGLYANAITDRLLDGWVHATTEKPSSLEGSTK